jgi:hypothetical protein
MNSKRLFFTIAAIILTTSACQNSITASPANLISNTSLLADIENINPSQPLSISYFSVQPTPLPAFCDNSTFVKDITISDNTEIEPGAPFIKKWKIKNTGCGAWTRKYSLQFVNGERMSGETTYLAKWVPPDQAIIISVELVAPEADGTHTGYWILTDANGTAFGNVIYVKIIV